MVDSSARFLGVVGASGSGKSSLVWAGLIPRLLGQAVPGDDEQTRIGAFPGSQDWLWVRFTPGEVGDNPFMALAVKLSPTLQKHGKTPRDLAAELGRDTHALVPWVQRVLEGKPDWVELLLFIDQFEELFTLVNPDYQALFVDFLAQAARTARLRMVATMRADFYHRCLDWETLAELLRTSSFPLTAPSMVTLHEMITRPAERAGLTFEAGLVERLLDDTGSAPGALAAWILHKESGGALENPL